MKNPSRHQELSWILALGIALMLGLSFTGANAQTDTSSTRHTTQHASRVPVGTEMRIRLENEIDSKKTKSGDTFTAVVLSPEKYMDATVLGHVAQVNQSGKIQGQTQVSLSFDEVKLNSGQTIPIDAQIVQIYDEKTAKKLDEEGNIKSGSQGKSTAVRTGGGAALGAIIGGIAGGGKGAAIGAAAGGGAGAGSKVITGPQQVRLPEGTELLIKTTK
ncbi:MAG: hypothetical protein J2P41_15775 [Blastocatellia bacterium]|nr:hypothetical protein [Blastocatellia bacterium]